MKTRIHRLYSRRLGDVNVADEFKEAPNTHELSKPNEYPAGEELQDQNGAPELLQYGKTRRVEGKSDKSELGAILAIKPTGYAARKIAESLPDLDIDPTYLHITLIYLGKDLSEETIGKIKDVSAHICDAHEPIKCKLQGLGLFDHADEDEGGQPFYASVDGKGLAALRTDLETALIEAGVECPSEYDFTPHMTLGYLHPSNVSLTGGSPGTKWTSNEAILMVGDDHTKISLGGADEEESDEPMDKEAGGFGQSLDDIISPGEGQGFVDNPADNHESENDCEDVDLKLGEVEAPYSDGQGPLSVNTDDELDPDKRYDVVRGANMTIHTAVESETHIIDIARQCGFNVANIVEQQFGMNIELIHIQTGSPVTGFRDHQGWAFSVKTVAGLDIAYDEIDDPSLDGLARLLYRIGGNIEPLINRTKSDHKRSVDLIDSGSIDQNRYTDGDNTRQDRSIPRDPAKEDLMY